MTTRHDADRLDRATRDNSEPIAVSLAMRPAPRANRERRLDLPFVIFELETRRIVARRPTRDSAETYINRHGRRRLPATIDNPNQ
jgi:hypothetical protein